jgi:hypothetical protein
MTGELEDIGRWGRDERIVADALRLFNLSIGVPFAPPWREASGPSARVYRNDSGVFICEDVGGSPELMILPELYAALVSGRAQRMSGKDRVVWTNRVAIETEWTPPEPIEHPPLPDSLSRFDIEVFRAFCLRWQCRSNEPEAAFGCAWATRWMSLPENAKGRVNKSLKTLRTHGLLHKVGPLPGSGTFTYIIGDSTPDPTLDPTEKPT